MKPGFTLVSYPDIYNSPEFSLPYLGLLFGSTLVSGIALVPFLSAKAYLQCRKEDRKKQTSSTSVSLLAYLRNTPLGLFYRGFGCYLVHRVASRCLTDTFTDILYPPPQLPGPNNSNSGLDEAADISLLSFYGVYAAIAPNALSAYIMAPIHMLHTRLLLQKYIQISRTGKKEYINVKYDGAFDAIKKIYLEEGLAPFFSTALPLSLIAALQGGFDTIAEPLIKACLTDSFDTDLYYYSALMFCNVLKLSLILPLETAVRRIQLQDALRHNMRSLVPTNSPVKPYLGVTNCIFRIATEESFASLYSGYYFHLGISSAQVILLYTEGRVLHEDDDDDFENYYD